jgi:hypothetical protein
MPGYRLQKALPRAARGLADASTRPLVAGASINDLRKAFLTADDALDSRDEQPAAMDTDVRAGRVVPEGGGPEVVVELRKGKLRKVSP